MKRGLFLLVLLVASCAVKTPEPEVLVPGDPSAPSQVTPAEAMAIAKELSTHPWRPFAGNILHGRDKSGIIVQTPDIGYAPGQKRMGWWMPGQVNEGIPYKWGGYDDSTTFDASVAAGLAAGDVSTPEKRRADNAAVSRQATGLDCSGFVSRCLKLPVSHDTRKLPSICDALGNAADLRPGDLLNIPGQHVVMCGGWFNPEKTWIYYYETGGGPQYWKPALKHAPLDKFLALGYKPLRYRGMARAALKPGESAKEVLTRAVQAKSVEVAEPGVGEP